MHKHISEVSNTTIMIISKTRPKQTISKALINLTAKLLCTIMLLRSFGSKRNKLISYVIKEKPNNFSLRNVVDSQTLLVKLKIPE